MGCVHPPLPGGEDTLWQVFKIGQIFVNFYYRVLCGVCRAITLLVFHRFVVHRCFDIWSQSLHSMSSGIKGNFSRVRVIVPVKGTFY